MIKCGDRHSSRCLIVVWNASMNGRHISHLNLRAVFRFRLRTVLLLVAFVALLSAYVGSYYRISRRGIDEAGPDNYWMYVSQSDVRTDLDNDRWEFLDRHYFYRRVYAPACWVDQTVFGTPQPVRGGTWKLTQSDNKWPGHTCCPFATLSIQPQPQSFD